MKWIRQFLDEDSDAVSSEGGVRDEEAFLERVGSCGLTTASTGTWQDGPLIKSSEP